MPESLSFFLSFLKIGIFTFGGGYAMIPLVQREVIDKGWVKEDEFLELLTLAQSAPGPIALNTAVFVGYKDVYKRQQSVLSESIAGDSVVAHALAYAEVAEGLGEPGLEFDPAANDLGIERTVALEMERIAMHLADTGALCMDCLLYTSRCV